MARLLLICCLPALLLCGCSEQAAPLATSRLLEPGRDESKTLDLTPRPQFAVKADHPAVIEAKAFLKELADQEYPSAAARTSLSMRRLLSGPLVFDEEKQRGYTLGSTEAYLQNERRQLKSSELQLHYLVMAPHGSEVSLRGADAGPYDHYPLRWGAISLRLVKEHGAWTVTRFATAGAVAVAIPPDSDDGELAWAREAALDFLEAKRSDGGNEMGLDLMTEDFKASLPANHSPDPGLKYSRDDVLRWLQSNRIIHDRHELGRGAIQADRATFQVRKVGRFCLEESTLTLVRDRGHWKVASFPLCN